MNRQIILITYIIALLAICLFISGCLSKGIKEEENITTALKSILKVDNLKNGKIYIFSEYDCYFCLEKAGDIIKRDFYDKKVNNEGIFVFSSDKYYNSLFDSLFKKTNFINWHKTNDHQLIDYIENYSGEVFKSSIIDVSKNGIKVSKFIIKY